MNKLSSAENVRFSRLFMTLFITSYALFGFIEGLYLMIAVAASTIILGSDHNISAYVLKFLSLLGFRKIFKLNPRYDRSFVINRQMELFEEVLRLLVGLTCVILYFYDFFIVSTVFAFFMAVMMLISTFFGFCMSGLFYIACKKCLGQNTRV